MDARPIPSEITYWVFDDAAAARVGFERSNLLDGGWVPTGMPPDPVVTGPVALVHVRAGIFMMRATDDRVLINTIANADGRDGDAITGAYQLLATGVVHLRNVEGWPSPSPTRSGSTAQGAVGQGAPARTSGAGPAGGFVPWAIRDGRAIAA